MPSSQTMRANYNSSVELGKGEEHTMQITEAFKGKLVITGGTGSFGSTVLKHFLTTDRRQRIL